MSTSGRVTSLWILPLGDRLVCALGDLASERARLTALVPSLRTVPRISLEASSADGPVTINRGALALLRLMDGKRTVADLVRLRGAMATFRDLAHLVELDLARLE